MPTVPVHPLGVADAITFVLIWWGTTLLVLRAWLSSLRMTLRFFERRRHELAAARVTVKAADPSPKPRPASGGIIPRDGLVRLVDDAASRLADDVQREFLKRQRRNGSLGLRVDNGHCDEHVFNTARVAVQS